MERKEQGRFTVISKKTKCSGAEAMLHRESVMTQHVAK